MAIHAGGANVTKNKLLLEESRRRSHSQSSKKRVRDSPGKQQKGKKQLLLSSYWLGKPAVAKQPINNNRFSTLDTDDNEEEEADISEIAEKNQNHHQFTCVK